MADCFNFIGEMPSASVNDKAKVDFMYAMSLFGMTDNTDNN